MIYILDTDHVSIAIQDTPDGVNLKRRLLDASTQQIATTIVTYEEQMRGWPAYIARADTPEKQVRAYRKLRETVDRLRDVPLLDYDALAAAEFERLRQARVRIGTMDLKIAAIALAAKATLLNRNRADFDKVPGLRYEDWSL